MKNPAVGNKLLIHIILAQHYIRAGVSVKRKLTVTAGKRVNKSKGSVHYLVGHQTVGIYPDFLHGFFQLSAENIIADFADKGCLIAQPIQHSKNIAGRTAGGCFHNGVALGTCSVLGEIYQQFAKRANIKSAHNQPSALSITYSSAFPITLRKRS